jgi:hypothetical protein
MLNDILKRVSFASCELLASRPWTGEPIFLLDEPWGDSRVDGAPMLSECIRASMPWASNVSDLRFVPSAVGVYGGGGSELISNNAGIRIQACSGLRSNESDLSNAPASNEPSWVVRV